jgi:uncharacterized protein (TIGR02996 family)
VTDPVLDILLTGIVAHPEDDGPRLAYADRLEETGVDDARADFIRVQLELTRLRPGPGEHGKASNLLARHRKGAPVRMSARTPATLLAREAILWGANYARWADALPGPWTAHGVNTTGGCQVFMSSADNSTVARLWFERGFPARIRLVSGDWLGGGVGWPGWGPALVRAAPLTLVSVSDRQPSPHPLTSMPRLWSWYGGVRVGHATYRLRWDLFKRLPGWLDQERMDYASRADAETALSLACLAWARAVAPPAPAPVD